MVALVWLKLYEKAFQLAIPLEIFVTLGATVWSIYVVDRLLDARLTQRRSPAGAKLAARHLYHWERRRLLVPLVGLVLLLVLWTAFFRLPQSLTAAGLIPGLLIGFYLVGVSQGQRSLSGLKELVSGLLFAFGTSLSAYSYAGVLRSLDFGLLGSNGETLAAMEVLSALLLGAVVTFGQILFKAEVLFFGLLCAQNIFVIHLWEQPRETPAKWDFYCWINALLSILTLTLALSVSHTGLPLLFGAISLSAGLLAVLHRFRKRFRPRLLRVLADVALLTPLLFLLL